MVGALVTPMDMYVALLEEYCEWTELFVDITTYEEAVEEAAGFAGVDSERMPAATCDLVFERSV